MSQNHRREGVGRDLWGASSPTPLPKQGHLEETAQALVQAGLECLQRGGLHSLLGQEKCKKESCVGLGGMEAACDGFRRFWLQWQNCFKSSRLPPMPVSWNQNLIILSCQTPNYSNQSSPGFLNYSFHCGLKEHPVLQVALMNQVFPRFYVKEDDGILPLTCLYFEEGGIEKYRLHNLGNKLWPLNFSSHEWTYVLWYPHFSSILDEKKWSIIHLHFFFFSSFPTNIRKHKFWTASIWSHKNIRVIQPAKRGFYLP